MGIEEGLDSLISEMVIRKRVVRKGKWKYMKVSTLPGYRVVGGVEKKMNPTEMRKRYKGGRRANKKMRAKRTTINMRRRKSMTVRGKRR